MNTTNKDLVHEAEPIPHNEATLIFRSALANLIQCDPHLNSLSPNPTLDEVKQQLAFEYGKAMKVNVKRFDRKKFEVIVSKDGTVHDLKKAIQRFWDLDLERDGAKKKVSWKYIWKTYWLAFEGEKLRCDEKKVQEYGLSNKCELQFVRKLREPGEKHR